MPSGLATAKPRAEVDNRSQIAVAIRARAAVAEAGGYVAGQDLSLPVGVLRGRWGDGARVGRVRHSGGVAAGENTFGAWYSEIRPDLEASLLSGQPESGDQGAGDDPGDPRDGVGIDSGSIAEHNVVGCDLRKGDADTDLDTAAPQHPLGTGREFGAEFGHHPPRAFDKYQSDVTRGEPEVANGYCTHRPQLSDEFGSRIRRPDDDDRLARRCALLVGVDTRQLELLKNVIAQI
jgi:hypothetical protein